MGHATPKQYRPLGGRTLLERAIAPLLAVRRIEEIVVVVAPGDERAASLPLPARVRLVQAGGASRAQSVRNGLRALSDRAGEQDFVLVHDAARPCLGDDELAELIRCVDDDPVGGLLAVPMGDTVKRSVDGRSVETVDRDALWRAATPQMFRYELLRRALESAAEQPGITDEASAIERLGLRPLLVAGDAANLKVTTPRDWALAEAILRMQGRW